MGLTKKLEVNGNVIMISSLMETKRKTKTFLKAYFFLKAFYGEASTRKHLRRGTRRGRRRVGRRGLSQPILPAPPLERRTEHDVTGTLYFRFRLLTFLFLPVPLERWRPARKAPARAPRLRVPPPVRQGKAKAKAGPEIPP